MDLARPTLWERRVDQAAFGIDAGDPRPKTGTAPKSQSLSPSLLPPYGTCSTSQRTEAKRKHLACRANASLVLR